MAYNGNGRGTRPRHATAYTQAINLQREIVAIVNQMVGESGKPETKETRARTALLARVASGVSMTSRAWCDLEERKRVLKMKGLPKSVDVEKMKEQRRAARAARQPKQPSAIEEPTSSPPLDAAK